MSRKDPQSGAKGRRKPRARDLSKPYEPTAREREAEARVKSGESPLPCFTAGK